MTDDLRLRDKKPELFYLIEDALKLVQMFHTADWTEEKKAEWLRISGNHEATTRVLCNHIRYVLKEMEKKKF